jgi:thioredoxin reductase
MTASSSKVPVAIVGAGPYGLSIAAHLRGRGIEARVFGEPMGGWRHHMPQGMFLKSVAGASSLSAPAPGFTLGDFCEEIGSSPLHGDEPVPIDLFIRYGLWFQTQLVEAVERVRVRRVAGNNAGFDLLLDSGEELQADAVVVASGQADFAHVPPQLQALVPEGPSATGRVSHTSQHRDFSSFSGRKVAVVGGGQSALESAALLHETGARAHVLVRRSPLLWADPPGEAADGWRERLLKPPSQLGPGWSLYTVSRAPGLVRWLPPQSRLLLVRKVLGPSGAWWLRDRVVGEVDLRIGGRIEGASVSDGRVTLRWRALNSEVTELAVDHVLAATGYRVNLDANDFLDPALVGGLKRVAGSPRLSASFESSVPGLFFTGLSAAATFGPLLRFVCGTAFAAHRITDALAERTRRRGTGL